MKKLFNYNEADSFVHNLSGVSKLIGFLAMTFTVMLTFDVRVIGVVMVLAVLTFRVSGIKLRDLKVVLYYISFFVTLNFIMTFIFDPRYGVRLYGTEHVLFTITERYTMTEEQLFYQLTKISKYAATIPFGLLFFLTTHPSEFAASMNRIGLHYKVAYTVSLTLRYLPDIYSEYQIISKAQQARGLEMSKKQKFGKRIKEYFKMIFPLIMSSLDRINNISDAMDLRGFAKHNKRTWYHTRKLSRNDIMVIIFTVTIFAGSVAVTIFINHGRFWNPFI
ncbi:energy-coupling factor transporter transmembrane component T family protein [Spirochaeta isovalerica]|uniref:Energy-coupling factor transport system permease protein n=1 Tax=Spirochaeta isovalerica TaxID=150 RepID=A0A841R9T6_9SPIO|nr:energy-coupling factor transporter transmembrane component T [Spirochaeta isovalerica]MBB6480526.1 energy-coupling factor transport system permease protein [Spirochaeta isovalerica]